MSGFNIKNRGQTPFTLGGYSQGFALVDFWQWVACDLTNNLIRGKLAEFIVAHALGIHQLGPLQKWESHDLIFHGKRIEIKASGYVQEWSDTINTNPRFSIRPSKKWDDTTGYGKIARRNSDIYIFCILAEFDKDLASLPILDNWEFYPVLTVVLNERLKDQKSVCMGKISDICSIPSTYTSLHDNLLQLIKEQSA